MSTIKTAVILAAGAGTRMGELGLHHPKGFIELDGQPIIELSLNRLKSAGIERIVVITGHRASFYNDLARRMHGMELVHNAHLDSGSMYSLYLAWERLNEDFLLLEARPPSNALLCIRVSHTMRSRAPKRWLRVVTLVP